MATNSIYFISGKGLRMGFNGNVYQYPDKAAIEEGERLAKIFKNVKVIKITGTKVEKIFGLTRAEIRQQKIQKNLAICFGNR